MASFGPPPPSLGAAAGSGSLARVGVERSVTRYSAAAPAGAQTRWRQAKVASAAAGKVGAWQRVAAQSAGEEVKAKGAMQVLSPATARFQSRLKEAEQIIIALREQAQLLQVQLDESRGEAADASLRLELVLAEATQRGMDLRGWLMEQVGDGATPLARPEPPPLPAKEEPARRPRSPPKNRDSSPHTTRGWGALQATLTEKPERPVPAMSAVVDKAAFPLERLKVETERVRNMSQDVNKRKKTATQAQLRAKKSEAKTREKYAKKAAQRR
eukprot:COSAG02_NODE_15188_length_1195_cov_1.485401_2_plen_270_part_01